MMRKEEYKRIKKARDRDEREWREYVKPVETDVSKMMEIYEEAREFLGGKITHRERDLIINGIVILYSPRTILEGRKCASGVLYCLSICLGTNRSVASKWMSEAISRYHRVKPVRDETERLYRYLVSVPPLKPWNHI